MRLILLVFILFLHVNAKNLDFDSISSDFTQTITSPEGSKIKYEGTFYAKKPYLALWHYTKPIEKSIYISNKDVLVVEPELDQVIVSKMENMPNISSILKNAKKISKNLYQTSFEDVVYNILVKNDKPESISYMDKLENKVSIDFSKTKINIKLKDNLFLYQIPKGYDIIRQ
ncbi:MAG: outer membrane lipoprotein chaperone LolA [Proteobacteria bacterium]|nr:MAG: outer membrane lipoprotein chaperone LolA [Pseudomonadota bacterium]